MVTDQDSCRETRLTTVDPMATPPAVAAIWAMRPGPWGWATTGAGGGGACTGAAGRGGARAGTLDTGLLTTNRKQISSTNTAYVHLCPCWKLS